MTRGITNKGFSGMRIFVAYKNVNSKLIEKCLLSMNNTKPL